MPECIAFTKISITSITESLLFIAIVRDKSSLFFYLEKCFPDTQVIVLSSHSQSARTQKRKKKRILSISLSIF